MMQIIEQTDEEKMAMYMKMPKKKLAEMLIQCNKFVNSTYGASKNLVQPDVIKSVCEYCDGVGMFQSSVGEIICNMCKGTGKQTVL